MDAVGWYGCLLCLRARTSHQGTLGAPRSGQNVAGRREHYSMGLVCLRCRFLSNTMSIASLCANEGCASSPTSGLQHGGSEV